MAGPNTARNYQATRLLRRWSKRFEEVGSEGPTMRAADTIAALKVASTIERMDAGVTPRGVPFKPLTAAYVKRKGHDIFWQLSGESRGKVQATVVTRKSIIIVINTPWSGWANSDGRVPRRVLGNSREDTKAIRRILLHDFKQQIGGAPDGR